MDAIPRERFPVLPGIVILEKLGTGAVGTVYLARHEALGRLVAVKVLRRELAGNRLYLERLRREARLSVRLDHPNIVKGFDLGDADGVPFFIMEFVDGKSLRTILKERGHLEEDEVLEYGLQLSRALDHAYRHGVVHRDVKPGNVLLSRDGTLKIADLGLARRPDDSSVTRDGVTLGTPHYISPEQARDPVSADVRSDLYSLGATLFHAATGRPPYDAETVAGVLTQVLDETIVPAIPENLHLSKNLELVLRRLLAKDPIRRYQTPDDLIRDLERVRRNERPHVSVFDINPAAKRRVRTTAFVIGGAVAVSILMIIVAKFAGDDGDSSLTAAAMELSRKLQQIEQEDPGLPMDLATRWRRVETLLNEKGWSAADRLRAVEFASRIETQISAVVMGLERACEQDLSRSLSEYLLSDAVDWMETTIRERFREPFGGSMESVPPRVAARIDNFLERKGGEVERAIAVAEARLLESLPGALASLEQQITDDTADGRYRSALNRVEEPLQTLEIPDGPAWRNMPHASRERIAGEAAQRIREFKLRILHAARDAAARAGERLRREHDRLEEWLRTGGKTVVSVEFEEIARRVVTEISYRKEEWPAQAEADPETLIHDLTASLRTLERQRERDFAEAAFAEYESRLAARWRERQYVAARDEWMSRASRTTIQSVKERMNRRIIYSEKLIEMRGRVIANLEQKRGKKLQLTLRAGGAVSGRLDRITVLADDATLAFLDSNISTVTLSSISLDDFVNLYESRDGFSDRAAVAVFLLADGDPDRSLATLSALRSGARDNVEIEFLERAILDVDSMKSIPPGPSSDRARRYDEAKLKARSFETIGDFEMAREWYEKAIMEASGLDKSDPRVAEAEQAIRDFELREGELRRARDLQQMYPGARVRNLPENRLEVSFDYVNTIEIPEDWTKTPTGILWAPRASQQDGLRNSPLKKIVAGSSRGPARATFRVWIPFDAAPAIPASRAIRAFTAFGRTLVFSDTGSRGRSMILLRANGLEGIESELENALIRSDGKPQLGFVRGCIHDVSIELDADGRRARAWLDGAIVATGEFAPQPAEIFEVRTNARVEVRSLVVSGVVPQRPVK